MTMNAIGKFAMRQIINEIEATLIKLYGFNLLDAHITRHEALNAYREFQCPRRAGEMIGIRCGLHRADHCQ